MQLRMRSELPLRLDLRGGSSDIFGGFLFVSGVTALFFAVALSLKNLNFSVEALVQPVRQLGEPWLGAIGLAVGGLFFLLVCYFVSKREEPKVKPVGLPVLLIGFLLVAGVTTVMLLWLLRIADTAPVASQSSARIDAIRTAPATAAGTGGAFGLLIAFRRQRTSEISERGQNADQVERRITELYGRAVDQMGNERAAVRLAALYSLERLAQDNLSQRQVIVDVICAYLRMSNTSQSSLGDLRKTAYSAKTDGMSKSGKDREEREVRLTAQKILLRHVTFENRDLYRDKPDEFWPDISIDLSGASLEELRLHSSEVKELILRRCTVKGEVSIIDSRILGRCDLEEIQSSTSVSIMDSVFASGLSLSGSSFAKVDISGSVVRNYLAGENMKLDSLDIWFSAVDHLVIGEANASSVDLTALSLRVLTFFQVHASRVRMAGVSVAEDLHWEIFTAEQGAIENVRIMTHAAFIEETRIGNVYLDELFFYNVPEGLPEEAVLRTDNTKHAFQVKHFMENLQYKAEDVPMPEVTWNPRRMRSTKA